MPFSAFPATLRQALLAAALLFCQPASASDASPTNGLPGVEGGHSIVKPKPAIPDEQPARGSEDRTDPATTSGRGMTFQAGDFEVTVSGSVSVEIGFGKRPPGGRR